MLYHSICVVNESKLGTFLWRDQKRVVDCSGCVPYFQGDRRYFYSQIGSGTRQMLGKALT